MLLRDAKALRTALDPLDEILIPGSRPPARMIKSHNEPLAFYFLEFDHIWSELFWNYALGVASLLSERVIYFGVLDPHPTEYYFQNFRKYPWLKIDPEQTNPASIIAELHEDPGASPADALATNSNLLAVYPPDLRWLILGDRTLEVAVLVCWDRASKQAWLQQTTKHFLLTVEDALDKLFPAILGKSPSPEFALRLRSNYRSRI